MFTRLDNLTGAMRAFVASALLSISLLATAQAERVTIPDSTLSLDIPAGFTKMDAAMVALKYARSNSPKLVYTTPDTQVNIAVSHDPSTKLPPEKVYAFGKVISKALNSQISQLKFQKNGPLKLAGRNWYELEFTMQAIDQPLYNHMLITSDKGRPLIVTVNATTKQLPKYKTALDAAIQSLK